MKLKVSYTTYGNHQLTKEYSFDDIVKLIEKDISKTTTIRTLKVEEEK